MNNILNDNEILEMFKKIDISMAVFDRNMNMIYMNEKANEFYKKMFHAENLLGTNVKTCHSQTNVNNIMALFQQFDAGKPFSFLSADLPKELFKSGHLSVMHMPIKKDGKVVAILEMPMETSFAEGGYCAYERTYNENDDFLDYSDIDSKRN